MALNQAIEKLLPFKQSIHARDTSEKKVFTDDSVPIKSRILAHDLWCQCRGGGGGGGVLVVSNANPLSSLVEILPPDY